MRERLRDYGSRTYLIVLGGYGYNLLYALINLLVGVLMGLPWFVTMGLYYLMLALMRLSAIEIRRRPGHTSSCIKATGILLIVLSFVIALISDMSISLGTARARDQIVMISIATYTFIKLVLTIRKVVRRKRHSAPFFRLIRTINYGSWEFLRVF